MSTRFLVISFDSDWRFGSEHSRHIVDELRAAASSYAGNVVVLTAPPATRDVVDLWGPVPGLALMRRLKDEMDPPHRFAPGRFVGGI